MGEMIVVTRVAKRTPMVMDLEKLRAVVLPLVHWQGLQERLSVSAKYLHIYFLYSRNLSSKDPYPAPLQDCIFLPF